MGPNYAFVIFPFDKYCCFNWILDRIHTHTNTLHMLVAFSFNFVFFFLTVDICLFYLPEANYCVSWIS